MEKSKEYYKLKKRKSRAKAKDAQWALIRKRIAFALLCERGMDPRLAFQQIYLVQNGPKDSLPAPLTAE